MVHVPPVEFMYPVRVTTGDSGLYFDVCVTSFKHLFVASARAVWASLSFRLCKSIPHLLQIYKKKNFQSSVFSTEETLISSSMTPKHKALSDGDNLWKSLLDLTFQTTGWKSQKYYSFFLMQRTWALQACTTANTKYWKSLLELKLWNI